MTKKQNQSGLSELNVRYYMDIFVARQAILNNKKQVIAYELLFRNGLTNAMDDSIDGYNATQNIVANSLVFLGLKTLTGGKRAFINFTDRNIKDGTVKLLPPQLVSVEILENVQPTKALISACKNLRTMGYQLVLDDFVFEPKYQPLVDLADVIKIDFLITKTASEREAIRKMIPGHIKLLAEKVETAEDYQQAISFGYEYFQGYFFCKPDIITRKALPVSALSQLLLIKEVNQSDFDVPQLEKIIKHDVALAHKLLQYINSPGIGIVNKINNIKQAIILLGLNGIRKWANLVSMRELSADKPSELFTICLIRAKFCELVANVMGDRDVASDTAFLMGIFSLLDVVLDRPMEEVLSDLGLSTELEAALLGKDTKLTSILHFAQSYERGNWAIVKEWCEKNNFTEVKLSHSYQQAICWSDTIIDIHM